MGWPITGVSLRAVSCCFRLENQLPRKSFCWGPGSCCQSQSVECTAWFSRPQALNAQSAQVGGLSGHCGPFDRKWSFGSYDQHLSTDLINHQLSPRPRQRAVTQLLCHSSTHKLKVTNLSYMFTQLSISTLTSCLNCWHDSTYII